MKDILYFLRQLCINNNREWFNDNRELYKQRKEEFEAIVQTMIQNVAKFDSSIAHLTAKDCTYRINRDIRFSLDKTPYKNHFGAFIATGGKKACTAGYYLHIEPDNSLLAGGVYMPPSNILLQLRTAIFENPMQFKSIIENPDFVKTFGELEGDKLIAAPRGFSKNFEFIELLKYKNYSFATSISDEFIEQQNVETYALDCFRKMKEINTFLNKAIGL